MRDLEDKMSRVVKKPEERRREIISVSQAMFIEDTYEKTSLNDVVNRLEVAKGTVYHYFKSKEELLDAVVDSMSDDYVQRVQVSLKLKNDEQINGRRKKKSAIERMRELIEASNVTGVLGETVERLHRPGNIGLHVRLLALSIKKLAPLYADVIRQGCEEGTFKTDFPTETAELLLAGIQFITDVGFYPWSREDISRRLKALSSLAESQLGATQGSLAFLSGGNRPDF